MGVAHHYHAVRPHREQPVTPFRFAPYSRTNVASALLDAPHGRRYTSLVRRDTTTGTTRWARRLRRLAGQALAVLILFGFFSGLIVTFGCLVELPTLYEARTWPSREGVLTHSYVRKILGFRSASWRAEIAGVYPDTGKRFGVQRVRYGFVWNSKRKTEAVVAEYPKNSRVTVYYSPTKPRTVILEPRVSPTGTWVALGIGLGLVFLPPALYVYERVTGWTPSDADAA